MVKDNFLLLFMFLLFFCCSINADDSLLDDSIFDGLPGMLELGDRVVFEPDPDDFDGDGLLNIDEERYGTDPYDPDSDNDGITDFFEITNGTDPNSPDTGGYLAVTDLETGRKDVTFSDDKETAPPVPGIENYFPPFPWDDVNDLPEVIDENEPENTDEYNQTVPSYFIDEEGLFFSNEKENKNLNKDALSGFDDEGSNQQTMQGRTSTGADLAPILMLLLLNDSDNDGIDDDWEMRHFGTLAYGAGDDPDQDNLSNLDEYKNNTDPNNPDSDGDGLTDGWEVLNGLNPNSTDTDADGLSDWYEVINNLDPLDPDMDDDGLLDGAEIAAGTDPRDYDTDHDGMPDFWEVTSGTNPLVNDRDDDLDMDLYSNIMEYIFHSDPSDPNDIPANASKGSYYEYDKLGRVKAIIRAK